MGTGLEAGGDNAALRGRWGLVSVCIRRLGSIVVGTELLSGSELGSTSEFPGNSSELPKLLILADSSELGWDEKQFR